VSNYIIIFITINEFNKIKKVGSLLSSWNFRTQAHFMHLRHKMLKQ